MCKASSSNTETMETDWSAEIALEAAAAPNGASAATARPPATTFVFLLAGCFLPVFLLSAGLGVRRELFRCTFPIIPNPPGHL